MPKPVQLSDEAYRTLAALKRPGESFSDVVMRLASSRKNVLALRRLKDLEKTPGWDPAALRRASDAADKRRMKARAGS